MLRFIYRLSITLKRPHSYTPNLVHLGPMHYEQLRRELGAIEDERSIRDQLGLEIMVSSDVLHPRVAWFSGAARFEKSA